jgi:hypothetical protein
MAERSSQTECWLNNVAAIFGVDREGNLTLGTLGIEGVGVMFFLIRYQMVVASSREISFARQFFSVSLVHRMETNIARHFFEVRLFIIAVQQNFGDAARNVLDCPEFSPDGKLESSPGQWPQSGRAPQTCRSGSAYLSIRLA